MATTVYIKMTQKREVEEGPLYKVTNTVNTATGIEDEIFVMNTETQAFEHVATVYDMGHWLKERDDAIEEDDMYYRASICYKEYESLQDAEDFGDYTSGRVEYLVNQYYAYVNGFPATTVYEYTGS